MLEKFEPIRVAEDPASDRKEDDQKDQTAAKARATAAEAEALLQPVEKLVEQKELE
jgi:hypothetical protein